MDNIPKKDDNLLLGCGGIGIVALILIVIAVIYNLVVNGKKGAREIANDDTIGLLRGGIIFIVIVGVIYFIKQSNRK